MKIGVLSDTHGDRKAIEQAVKAVGAADLWLHAGDHCQDSRKIRELTGMPVVTVLGNCDGYASAKPDEFIDLPGCRIWLTHGHRYNVRDGRDELLYWARTFTAQVVVYGHTHIPDVFWDQDLLVFNPGSASRPRGGFAAGCGLLTLSSAGVVSPMIIEL
jgi:putative phosphoesterase